MNLREQLEKEITEKVMVKLAEQEIKLGSHEIELAYTIDNLVKDVDTLKGKINAAINAAARFSFEYDNMLKMSSSLGITLPKNVIEAGKYAKAVEKIKI